MKNFGFGCMRLPKDGDKVDYVEFTRMVDAFLETGFTYFDTAHVYIGGQSETALRDCLVKRYPRSAFQLTDKLSGSCFQKEEDILPFFQSQLDACGVDYFDYYLMHAQNATVDKKFTATRAYEICSQLKAEGKIKHLGISFHDKAAVLDQLLTKHPEIEAVQIQFNYVDYEDASIQSRQCYEVCRAHNKPIIVMEPVKGGSLVNLPAEAQTVLSDLHGGSNASYAIRFAASFEGVMMVLSGMSDLPQMNDNLSYMKEFQPLTPAEFDAIAQVRDIYWRQDLVPCTGCRYCVDGCPKQIPIPELFTCLNALKQEGFDYAQTMAYERATEGKGKASDCIRCGKCEDICPQGLRIRRLLETVAARFEAAV
ncbi:MAG: aldo/keto reductase [Oscillospiraceae bacterium]|nr:aldo/keto reductase [Oscillospiraceae bacterium]